MGVGTWVQDWQWRQLLRHLVDTLNKMEAGIIVKAVSRFGMTFVAGVSVLVIAGVGVAGGVKPEQARLRVVNMMPSNATFAKVTLQSSDGKNIRGLKYTKGKGFLKKEPGSIAITEFSDEAGQVLLGPGAFPSTLAVGHDYTCVLNLVTGDAANLVIDVDRAVKAPGDGYARVYLINAMTGHDLILQDANGSIDFDFEHGDVSDVLLHAPTTTEFHVFDQVTQGQQGPTVVFEAKENTTYYVIFGGTTETGDLFQPTLNVYKSKY